MKGHLQIWTVYKKASKVCTTPEVSNSSASAEIVAQGRSPGEKDWLCSVSCGTP